MKKWWKNFWPIGHNRPPGPVAGAEVLLHNSGISKNYRGFSLLEVLIAITAFAIFLSSYVIGQGQNLSDSARLQEDLVLRRLSEDVINQIVLNPPDFAPSLALAPVTKKFEDEYEDYEYTIEYKKIELPNIAELTAGRNEGAPQNKGIQSRIYQQVKDNVGKMLWQVAVTVRNIHSENSYIVSTWIKNPKAKVKISL